METFTEVKSLGPCSEEAEAALTDEVMLSLWYGGLNRIYVQKFREEGRWVLFPAPSTLGDFLRAWASDAPHLRALAYYCRAMSKILVSIIISVLFWGWLAADFLGSVDESSRLIHKPADFLFCVPTYLLLAFALFLMSRNTYREWMERYRTLTHALEAGRDPDLADRTRMTEMRRAILGWAWNSGYVRYDRKGCGWNLSSPRKRRVAAE